MNEIVLVNETEPKHKLSEEILNIRGLCGVSQQIGQCTTTHQFEIQLDPLEIIKFSFVELHDMLFDIIVTDILTELSHDSHLPHGFRRNCLVMTPFDHFEGDIDAPVLLSEHD